ncbi:hypothetical protein NUW58_g1683 [Xylaria curta]|uniref:Uncharacterized protein n=1 Tax=Xylaria curta TaxID=42375 RepID=A0ACC1PK15_9PEZI|nr:hypothetical protein NUW58_g1683 [Xylaria curta]
MQLGTGFNSFTQQICINDAVTSVKEKEARQKVDKNLPVAQDVVYKTSIIDKVTDVTNEMNINAAFAIKYDAFDAKGKVGFLNTSKVKEADVTFLISVKVVNQVIYDHSLIHFNPIDGVEPKNFTEVYGDSFVSGYQEGGTFTAVISVKARNESKARQIRAEAMVKFTQEKEPKQKKDGEQNQMGLGLDFSKEDMSFLDENETTISVSYTGGGQQLKRPAEDWTFETMRNAALRFPTLVAETPMRTHAILTKYTALRSYHAHFSGLKMPAFEMAGVYSTVLQEAYLDFKTIAKNLQVLAYDVSAGQTKLISASEARRKIEQANKPSATAEGDGVNTPSSSVETTNSSNTVSAAPETCQPVECTSHSNDDTNSKNTKKQHSVEERPYTWKPIQLTKEYPPTLQGLEDARSMVRTILIRIVQEINILSKFPDAAMDEERVQPHISPFLFKEFLPVGEPIKKETSDENDLDPVERQMAALKASGGRQGF